jgi:hypothetical protein
VFRWELTLYDSGRHEETRLSSTRGAMSYAILFARVGQRTGLVPSGLLDRKKFFIPGLYRSGEGQHPWSISTPSELDPRGWTEIVT